MNIHNNKIKILMFPWLAYGHISPFLELSKKLSHKNFTIYFSSTPVNLKFIKQKLNNSHESIQLVEFHLPTLPELPSNYHTTKSLPPQLMPKLKEAYELGKPQFSKILENLKPDLVIYDLIQPWVPEISSENCIPAVEFMTTCAAMAAFMLHVIKNPNLDFPFPEIYLRNYEENRTAHLKESSENQSEDKDRPGECMERSSDLILIKTFREIEGKYLDYLSVLLEKKIVPVGPLVEEEEDLNDESEEKYSNIMNWLNKKDPNSTVFVSFGSELTLSKREIEEIANGLEQSKVNFIWVIRFQKDENFSIEESLPEGFVQRVGEKGMVMKNWSPQRKILKHESIGGFVSHCGWSSVMEALKFGVPIIGIPLLNDEPINARVLVDFGVGMEALKDENGGISRTEVAEVIRKVMVEENGEGLRAKARLVSEKLKSNGEEEIDGLVEDLIKLCKK